MTWGILNLGFYDLFLTLSSLNLTFLNDCVYDLAHRLPEKVTISFWELLLASSKAALVVREGLVRKWHLTEAWKRVGVRCAVIWGSSTLGLVCLHSHVLTYEYTAPWGWRVSVLTASDSFWGQSHRWHLRSSSLNPVWKHRWLWRWYE